MPWNTIESYDWQQQEKKIGEVLPTIPFGVKKAWLEEAIGFSTELKDIDDGYGRGPDLKWVCENSGASIQFFHNTMGMSYVPATKGIKATGETEEEAIENLFNSIATTAKGSLLSANLLGAPTKTGRTVTGSSPAGRYGVTEYSQSERPIPALPDPLETL